MKNSYIKLASILVLFLILNNKTFSQVLITDDGTTTPDASAMLEIKSSDKGMLIPRMSTANREALHNSSTAKPGLLVFDTDLGSFFIYGKTAKGTDGWVDLSSGGTIWEKSGNNIYLANSNYNVGIGTNTPSKKLVLKATNDKDTLFEILDKDGKPLMLITPTLSKFYFNQSTTKGVAGGFAVGRYAAAKADILDTALFLVTPDSTRVYTSGVATKGVAGGFAVGRYAGAKGEVLKYFYTDLDSTRVYTDGSGTKGVAGGFAVGRYAPAKGEETQYFNTNINNTRVYTDGGGTKGVAGGFAVGRYAAAKGTSNNYMYMIPDNYFIGHQSGDSLQNSNYTGKYNTFFGYKSGLKDTIGGSNVFIGYKSGMNTTGSRITTPSVDTLGSRNVFLGYEAGINNENGSDNVLLGYKAGHSVTNAGNNISIGSQAGYNNAINSDNIFIGRNAGYNHTGGSVPNTAINNIYLGLNAGYGDVINGNRGSNNVFIGNASGSNNYSGYDNIFIGDSVGPNNTTGHHNVFMGNFAGKNNTEGYYNVYIGFETGLENETDDYNTFIGYQAGKDTKNNGYGQNVFLGAYTGKHATTGTRNTFLGYQAGVNAGGSSYNTYVGSFAGANGAGSNNVFIGDHAGYDETGSNKLYIDNSNTLTPLIYGEFDNNLLRINGILNINNEYSFPTTDGTNGYVLTTDGAGNISWTSKNANTDVTTASNGLTETSDDIKLGGTLIQNTTINTNSYNLKLSTASGDQILTIEADSDNDNEADNPKISFIQDGGAVVGNIGFEGNGGTTYTSSLWNSFYIVTESDLPLQLGTNNTARLSILNSGDVGIGTISPSQKLDVNGDIRLNKNLYFTSGNLFIYNGNNKKVFDSWWSNSLGNTGLDVEDYTAINSAYDWTNDEPSSIITSNEYPLIITIGSSSNPGVAYQTALMTMNNNGNLGIGTTSPDYKLQVNGNIVPETHEVYDLGTNSLQWNYIYGQYWAKSKAISYSNKTLSKEVIENPLKESKNETGFIDINSLPKELRTNNSILSGEMTVYNYQLNYEQQVLINKQDIEIEKLKEQIQELKKIISELK